MRNYLIDFTLQETIPNTKDFTFKGQQEVLRWIFICRLLWIQNDFDQISIRLVDMFVSLLSVSWTDGDVVLAGLVHYVSILDMSWAAVVTDQSTCVQLCPSTASTEVQ